jgi:hypothetical protein
MTVREILYGALIVALMPVAIALDLFDSLTGRWRRP